MRLWNGDEGNDPYCNVGVKCLDGGCFIRRHCEQGHCDQGIWRWDKSKIVKVGRYERERETKRSEG